mgnify:CR=1 FL=1
MKKIEVSCNWVKKNLKLFSCPDCHGPFIKVAGYSVFCAQGHTFDFAKKGTLYLAKHHRQNNYESEAFWQARQTLLQTGLFEPIYRKIASLLPLRRLSILDAGCGQGAALSYLAQKRNFADTLIGFDLSKKALNFAVQNKEQKDVFFCAADLANLPFADHGFDVILDIFTTSAYAEFNRVLNSAGMIFKVIPDNQYLIELRHLLYEKDSDNYQYDNEKVKKLFYQHYPQAKEYHVKYQFKLTKKSFQELLQMTPLQWGASSQRLQWAADQELTQITIEIILLTTICD